MQFLLDRAGFSPLVERTRVSLQWLTQVVQVSGVQSGQLIAQSEILCPYRVCVEPLSADGR